MSLGGIDLSGLLSDPDFARPFTIRRQTLAMTADGETVTTSADTSAIGALQPASPAEIQMLPEGDRLKDVVMVASNTEIKATLGAPDILVIGGSSYRVIKVEERVGYWKAFAEGFTP